MERLFRRFGGARLAALALAWTFACGGARAENGILTRWNPEVSAGLIRPLGSLGHLTLPAPALALGLESPYAGALSVYAELAYAYLRRDEASVDAHLARAMAGFRWRPPRVTWLVPCAGVGYHYLKGAEEVPEDSPYEFIEDGESEAAFSLGLLIEPRFAGLGGHLFAALNGDWVLTAPQSSLLGLARLGWRF